jgi:plastocyanin
MTRRTRIIVFALAAGTILASPTAALGQNRLIATVGTNDARVISLNHENGNDVTDIPAGTYEILVRDRSDLHNFHLEGPGVDESTTVGFVGTVTWRVTFRDNSRYTYVCDPHSGDMNGAFTVGGGPPSPPPAPPAPPPPVGSRLFATVGPGFTISFRTARGGRITRVRAGRYTIVVRDRSRSHSFHLYGRGVNKRTRIRFAGTVTWRVSFRRGALYRFRCNAHPRRMRGSFRA